MLNRFNNFLKLFDGTDHQVSRLKDIISVTPLPLLLCSSQSSETKNSFSLNSVSLLTLIDLPCVGGKQPKYPWELVQKKKTKPKPTHPDPTGSKNNSWTESAIIDQHKTNMCEGSSSFGILIQWKLSHLSTKGINTEEMKKLSHFFLGTNTAPLRRTLSPSTDNSRKPASDRISKNSYLTKCALLHCMAEKS